MQPKRTKSPRFYRYKKRIFTTCPFCQAINPEMDIRHKPMRG